MNFSIEADRVKDSDFNRKFTVAMRKTLEKKLGFELTTICDVEVADGYLCTFSEDSGVIVSLRIFNKGLITLNIEHSIDNCSLKNFNFTVSQTVQRKVDNFYSY